MWQLTKEITIRMDLIWRTLAVVLVLFSPELNAASSSAVLSGFASSVLPSISSNTLYPSIHNLTSSTNGGFATAERSTKLANNATSPAQLPSIATLSLSAISSILKTETSVLETRTMINRTTTIPLGSSQSVSASQTSIEVVMSTVSLNYSLNTSSVPSYINPKNSSTVMVLSAIRTSTASSLQTPVMSPSVQQGSVSANMTHLTPVVSLAANLSGFVSATRTFSLTQSSSAVAKATASQSHLSRTVSINNGSSTGLPSQSVAGTLTLQLETSRMASSSSVAMATNRTLSTSHAPSSMVIYASKSAIESPSTLAMSSSISATTSGKSIFESKEDSMNETVAIKSTTIHETPVMVTVNSSVHTANATPTTVLASKATISPTHSADTTLLSTFQNRSSVASSTLQASTVLSSVGMALNQTRPVAEYSSAPSSVGVGEASSLVASPNATSLKSTSIQISIIFGVSSSPIRASSSLAVSKNATIQSSTSVSLNLSKVAAPSSTASIGVVSSIAEEKQSSVSSLVVMSSRLPFSTSVPLHTSPLATSSSVKVEVTSSMATAASEGPSSTSFVVSSRSQNVTSQSSLSGRLTPSSKTAALSRSSVEETVASPAASVTPNKTSSDEGFIVTSYSTPCYIYYVVEKTVFPVTTANHSAVPSKTSTTPKITLDIGSATRLHSGLPTVTLTHTVAMTTQVSKAQSQMLGSTDAITSSTGLVGESVKSSRLIAPTPSSTQLLSKTSEVLGTATSKVVLTDSSTVPSVMRPSVSSSITSDSRNTTDVSTFQTGILSTQVQSLPSQSGTLAIPRVTTLVMELQSTSMTNKTLGSSPTILPGSFTPVVGNASVSETQNIATTIPTGALSSTESFQSTHGSSSIMFTSSVDSRAFVPTVAPSFPSQNVSSATTVSGVSQVISSDSAPATTQASDGSVFPSKSESIIQVAASSEIPTTAVLLTNTTRLSQMPSPTSSGNLLSVAVNETTTKSISSPPVLLSSLATVSQNRTLSTVSMSVIGSGKNSSSVGSVEQVSSLAQTSSMSQPVASSSTVQMLPSSDTPASPSTSPVMELLSTVVSQVISMSTQIISSPQAAASSSPAGNRTSASSIEMIPSSAAIHTPSNTSSSVGEPLSSVMLSQAGTASTPTSNNTQVAPSSSLSQAGNKTSDSSTQMLPSSSIHMLPGVNTSIGEPLSSAMLSLSTTVSQAGGMSSLQVAVSSSFLQADNKTSATERLPLSSSSSSLESVAPLKRKKRAVADPNSATSVIESSSSAMLTSSVGKTVISTSHHSSTVTLILPSSLVASQTLQISNSVMQTAEAGSSHSLVPTYSTSSASEQKPTSNTTSGYLSVAVTTGSVTSSLYLSPSQHANVTESHFGSITRSPSSAPLYMSITPSGTLTQSDVALVPSSLSKESSVPQENMTAHVVASSTFVDNGTLPSTSPLGQTPMASAVLINSSSTVAHSVTTASVQGSSVGVVISSMLVDNGTLPSTSSLGNSTSTLAHSLTSVSSSVQSSSVGVVVSSAFVGNDTVLLTSSLELKSSPSTLLSNNTSTLAHSVKSVSSSIQSSSAFVDNSTLPSTSSLDLMMSSSLSPGTSSSFVVVVPTPSSVSLGRVPSSLTQQPLESSVTISSSPLPTKIRNFSLSSTASSSQLANVSVMPTELQSASDTSSLSIPPSSAGLSIATTDLTSQAVSRSVVTHPSPSAVESSEILQTIVSSSVTAASSSRLYRPPLVTISSLGICYVVYTTRIVQPSLVSTRPVNMSSTASLNVSSTRGFSVVMNTTSKVSPSVSLNTSSAVVHPTLEVNVTRSQSSRVVSTTVHVEPSGSSSSVQISSTVEVTLSYNVSQSSSSASSSTSQIIIVALTTLPSVKETSSLATSTYLLSKTPSISTSKVLLSSQAPTSQVISPSRAVSQVVSSSVTAPPTQPPDPSSLIETVLTVSKEIDVLSYRFRKDLEGKLAEAYSFSELRRRRRATPEINASINSIQRVNNGENVNVTFFITKDGQNVPASNAVQNYQKLSKDQLGNLIKYDVVSMPQALVVPPTPSLPPNILVSLIIKASASGNISVPENKKRLEDKLAAYYKEKKQLTTTVTASIKTIIHEPNEIDYLEFYISVSGQAVNASDVVQTFKVHHVNLLTAQLGVQVLVQAYIPDSLTATEADYVIIGMSVPENQDLTNASFRSDLGDKLVTVYQKGKGKKNSRRKKRSGSTSATIKKIERKPDSTASEAAVTFFVFDAGKVMNASYVVSVMNRLSTSEMTTFTRPYAILSAPKRIVPIVPTEVTPTVAATPIKWWIIPAVLGPILLIIIIILLVCWRWKRGAPKSKVEPDTIRMLDSDKRKPVRGFDVARFTEPGVSGMKTTSFMTRPTSIVDDEEAAVKPVTRETSLRRKVAKRPIHKPPAREQRQGDLNPAYEEEEEEEDDESVVSVTPTGSTQGLIRGRTPAKPPSATRKTPAKPQRPVEPSEMDSEEDSELSEGESESEPESVAQPEQTRHSAAQVPTVAVMSEASGPPRYPPVRFRSSVHPAPSLPPLNAKQTSLVGVKVEPPSEDDSTRGRRRKGKVTKRELEQRADLERQKNKQRLRDRKRNSSYSPGAAVPAEKKAWDRAQPDIDDVLGEDEAERVITGKKRKPRRRRPPSSSVATDEEGVPHLKSYRKLKSPKTTSSVSTRDRDKKRRKSTDSVSNASSDESEIDMNETRRRMHAILDDAFTLLGPQLSKKRGIDPEGQPAFPEAHPEAYPATPARPAVIPRYIGGQPALPEPPPAHGRATEPTARQRRRVQPTMPGYPAGMPQTPIGMPGYPGRTPVRPPIVTRDPIVVWDPADRQRILNQRAPPPTHAYRDPSGQNVYITPVQQQRDDMGGLVWSPYAAEDSMDALYPDLAQASYPGALGTSPPNDTSFLSHLQAAPPHDTVLNMSPNSTLDQRGASLGQSPQPLIKSIKDELFRLSQGASRKTPITEL